MVFPSIMGSESRGNFGRPFMPHFWRNCGKAETVGLLRQTAAAAASTVRGLSDEQLDRSQPLQLMGGGPVSAQMFTEMVLIGHVQEHTKSIKAAIGGYDGRRVFPFAREASRGRTSRAFRVRGGMSSQSSCPLAGVFSGPEFRPGL